MGVHRRGAPIASWRGRSRAHIGARHIVITDVNLKRLKLATEVADVTPVDVTKEDLKEVMRRLRMTEGFDYSDILPADRARRADDGGKRSADVQMFSRRPSAQPST